MRVLIVPDKFKGTLTAQEAAEAIAAGWRQTRPADEINLLPMTDGGDGFGQIIGSLLDAQPQHSNTINAAHDPIEAEWWWSESRQTAIVESAKVIGLAMLPPGKFHPFELDTTGLGQLLRHITSSKDNPALLIGIAGSATNDAGFGLARGLGYQFFDGTNLHIHRWLELDRLFRIKPPEIPVPFRRVTIACDVQNPLMGPEGASRIYGPQKGLRSEDLAIADRCFERFTDIVRKNLGKSSETEAGTGAAGGLGYGLRVFLHGEFKPGFDIFADAARLRERMSAADLIITGEGAVDRQTPMGKGTGAVAHLARITEKRCIALAGFVSRDLPADTFELAAGIVPSLTSREEAIREPFRWLAALSSEVARKI